jgi:hypothetical protein
MRTRSRLLALLRDLAPLIVVIGLFAAVAPAAAQLFPFFGSQPRQQRGYDRGWGWGGGGGGWYGDPYFGPQQPRKSAPPREDFSRAPAPEKRDSAPERSVIVLGDAMADWLGYGLEDAYSEQPDMGVLRKHRTVSGLIRYQPKGEPADWPAAARAILATENPAAIVIMLGMNDRTSIREPARSDKPAEKKAGEPAKAEAKPAAKPGDKPGEKSDATDAELAADDPADASDAPPGISPDKSVRSPNGVYAFREERWVELYAKKIEDMIAAAKAKNVPVLWVGLPALRGPKATADMLFLNALYRDGAQKAGITYVDVWDGFVDEAGRFMQQGPDFEGQTRRLRSHDGVFFTKAGARKLAHYVEREVSRLLAARSAPVEMPTEPEKQPDADEKDKPGGPPPRPLWGPILPLVVASAPSDQLMGGPGGNRAPQGETEFARVVVRGEPLVPPPGRADDGVWPRREVGREAAPKGGEMPEIASAESGEAAITATHPASSQQSGGAAVPGETQKRRRVRPIQQAQPAAQQQPSGFGFFGLGGWQQRQAQPQQGQAGQRQVRAPSVFSPSPASPGWFMR